MEEKIYNILRNHKLSLEKRESLIKDLLDLFGVVGSYSTSEVVRLFEKFELDRSRYLAEDAADILPLDEWLYNNGLIP